MSILPRLMRLRDAPAYLGMDRNGFNRWVRPYVTEIPVGARGIGFDRLELDAWLAHHKSRHGRPGSGALSIGPGRSTHGLFFRS